MKAAQTNEGSCLKNFSLISFVSVVNIAIEDIKVFCLILFLLTTINILGR